jgi:hypothetical protein
VHGRTGRPRTPDRDVLEGIAFVLATGIGWAKLPAELGYGSGWTCWRRLQEWAEAGVFDRLRSWRAPGPDLVFPADRSWLLSRLWDDDWRCLGGPTALIDRFLDESQLLARRVGLTEDATPPGHVAR